MTRHVPLVAARRRYGLALLALALAGLLAVVAVVLGQTPPSLRKGSATLALLLVAICLGTGLLSLLWTAVIIWPEQRRRLGAAQRVRRPTDLPPRREQASRPLALVLVAGVLVGGLLWTVLNTLGFIATPMLWLIVSAINLEMARLVRRVERRTGVTYYELPASPLFGLHHGLFALQAP